MKQKTVYVLTILRILTGWYFLYEGIVKLIDPVWSAKYYLLGSTWIFSGLFHQMAESSLIMGVVDFLNIWGLILIGLSFFTGFLVRFSSLAGFILLIFYFAAYPPISGYTFGAVSEGSYLWVNKTLLQSLILLVFAFMPNEILPGFDRWIKRWREEKAYAPVPGIKDERFSLRRRELLLDLVSLPFFGAFAYAFYRKKKWDSYEEKFLTGQQTDARSGATLLTFNTSQLNELQGQIPKGKIHQMDLSRLIMGGNLIGGWAHARDLIYASQLVKSYHTDERVMMTMQLAERCGIDSIIINPSLARIVNKYWRETGGKMKFISDCGHSAGMLEGARMSEDMGAAAMYCHGGVADRLVQEGKFDEIIKTLELIRSYGKPAGIGAHLLETVQGCVEQGIKPDFWVKTLHHHNYWSAQVDLERKNSMDFRRSYSRDATYTSEIKKGVSKSSNMYCYNPQATIDYMNKLEEPFIAFKVLAAGAIHPRDAFRYSFENGADFICVGMYDFQVVEDCNIALNTLETLNRVRSWRA
jgi:uncharacterized membrane protein YphA (DoxX/SURF4 family)